jgi:YkoY family integral membrane protein
MELFSLQSLAVIGVLVLLEGLLSLDNALVLAIMARGVRPELRKKALTYGMVGAVVFRMAAIGVAATLMKHTWVKFLGGAYLLYLVVQYFFFDEKDGGLKEPKIRGFWTTVLLIELTDMAFAVDSIMAAVGLTKQYWLIVIGGLIGTLLMRYAANAMIGLLEKYSRLETTAYLLILIIGCKLILEGFHFDDIDFHSNQSAWFWGQWILMSGCIAYGLKKKPASKL